MKRPVARPEATEHLMNSLPLDQQFRLLDHLHDHNPGWTIGEYVGHLAWQAGRFDLVEPDNQQEQ